MMGEKLSLDAKALMGCIFGMNGSPTLTFQLVESRPSPRCQKALDELVSAGAVVKTPLQKRADGSAGVAYKACWPGAEFRRFANKATFPINEPIKSVNPKDKG